MAVRLHNAGVADPDDDREELSISVADAFECSWFVGFATIAGKLLRWVRGVCEAGDGTTNGQAQALTMESRET